MSYQVLQRVTGRRETRRIDLPIVPWGGYLSGWGPGWPPFNFRIPAGYVPVEPLSIGIEPQIESIYSTFSIGTFLHAKDGRVYRYNYYNDGGVFLTPETYNFGEAVHIRGDDGTYFAIGKNTGKVWCCGRNWGYSLGLGISDTNYVQNEWIIHPYLTGARAVCRFVALDGLPQSSMDSYGLVALKGNEVLAWGYSVKKNARTSPVKFADGSFVDVAVTERALALNLKQRGHISFFLSASGNVYLYGRDYNGIISGTGGYDGVRFFDMELHPYISGVKKLKQVDDAMCLALKSDGTVWVWGHNTSSITGDGLNSDETVFLPRKVPSLQNIVDISCSFELAFALNSAGEVYVWGGGIYGTGYVGLAGEPTIVPIPTKMELPAILALWDGHQSPDAYIVIPKSVPDASRIALPPIP